MALKWFLTMKKIIRILLPLFFGVILLLFYLLLYPSPLGSDSFDAALLMFFTAVGSGGVIIFSESPPKGVFLFYFSISIAVPLVLMLFFNFFPTVQLKSLLALMVFGLVWLKIFVAAHFKHERRKGNG